MVDMFVTKINHKLPLYCLTSPRCQCTEHRCIEQNWEGLDSYVFCPVAVIPKVIKNEHLQVHDCSGPRLGQAALVWRPSESVNKASIITSLASFVETAIQPVIISESVVSESSCLTTRHHSISPESFSEQVAKIIKAPQRSSSRRLYESRCSFLDSSAKRIGWSAQSLPSQI